MQKLIAALALSGASAFVAPKAARAGVAVSETKAAARSRPPADLEGVIVSLRLLVPVFFAGAAGAGAAAGSGAAVSSSALTRSEARCADGATNAAAPESARATMSFCIFLDLCAAA